MAGCELNVAHAFVSAPAAHRLRHDVIVTSADEFDASRRRRCVEYDDETEVDRAGVIPHYRLASGTCGPGGSSEWVTLSKTVLLQLVERICQLSFQTDTLSAAAAASTCSSANPPCDRFETSAAILADAVKSTDATSLTSTSPSVTEVEQPGHLTPSSSDSSAGTALTPGEVEISNTDSISDLTATSNRDVDDVPASIPALVASGDTAVVPSREFNADEATQVASCDDDDDRNDSDVFTGPEPMQEGDTTIDNSSSLADTSPSTSSASTSDISVLKESFVSGTPAASAQKLPTTTSLRSTQSLRADRRRRLRELHRVRRHHHNALTADEQSRDRFRVRRHDMIVRRQRFAVPHQPPPRFQDAERLSDGTTSDVSSPIRLPMGRRYGRVSQPWSALNKVVVCRLVDILLSQELKPMDTTWRSAATSCEKRRSSGTIWNPAITPETRECRTPTPPPLSPTVNDLSSLVSPLSAERRSSTLLHSLLSPTMAAAAVAATTLIDRRRSDMSAVDGEVSGGSLAWTMSQSSSVRRRHHSAAAPDTFRAPWTPPSFFWYTVPPSQGSFVLLPDAASRPCYRWIGPTQTATLPPASATADACPLDYCTRMLDASGCPDVVDNEVREAAPAVTGRPGLLRRRGSRPSTPPASASGRRGSSARLKWVIVNKTDVCSLFESLASSMVADGDENPTSDQPGRQPTTDRRTPATDQGSRAAGSEPIKWKSTLLRRAQAEAHDTETLGQ